VIDEENTLSRSTINRMLIVSLFLFSCSLLSQSSAASLVNFKNPPAIGSTLSAQRTLVGCTNIDAAKHTSATGFMHPECRSWFDIEPNQYRVISRSKVNLTEGDIWLLEVMRENAADNETSQFWVPIPWHDWV